MFGSATCWGSSDGWRWGAMNELVVNGILDALGRLPGWLAMGCFWYKTFDVRAGDYARAEALVGELERQVHGEVAP